MSIPHCRATPTVALPKGRYPLPSATGHIFDGADGYPSAAQSFYGVDGNLESVVSTLYPGATQFSTNWYMVHENTSTEVDINGSWGYWGSNISTGISDMPPYCVSFYSAYYDWAVGNTC